MTDLIKLLHDPRNDFQSLREALEQEKKQALKS